MGRVGALLALWWVSLAAEPGYRVQVAEPEAWQPLLATVGLEATADKARFRIVIGVNRKLGVAATDEKVRAASVVDERDPDLQIFWAEPGEVPVYALPAGAKVFVRERHGCAPLPAGVGDTLWLAVEPGAAGYERFPYLLHALVDVSAAPPFRGDRLWAFFDSSYRLRADPDYLARQWRAAGIVGLHVAAWHYYDTAPEKAAYLRKLIEVCRREGILVYAWLELPHVSEGFWEEHAECREKTATLQDAKLDWRKLIDLTDGACAQQVEAGVARLLTAFDWDGVNLGELYFESLHGPDNPGRFTPMNETARAEAAPVIGFDPLEFFDAAGPRQWSKQPAAWKAFVDYRAELALRLQQHWLGVIRATLPEADVVVTQIDDQFEPRMRELLGADAARLLDLNDDFTLLIEDPAPLWSLGPERYPEIARRYQPLTDSPERLAIDINIVERYQQTYPTLKQTGGELLQLVDRSSRSFARVALYFKNSISPVDLALLPQATASAELVDASQGKLVAEAPQPCGVHWSGFAQVDGAVWPVVDANTVWLPAGRHTIEPAAVPPPGRILRFTGDLLAAQVVDQTVSLSYKSSAGAVALLDRRPAQVAVDGVVIEADLAPPSGIGRCVCLAAVTQLHCRSSGFVTIPSQMAGEVQTTELTGTPEIPNRLFFRIGDVADLAGLEAYVLRYWETEFPVLKPKKTSNGQRQYRRKDVEVVLEIKRLLYDEGYTIAGARKALKDKTRGKKTRAITPKRAAQGALFADPSNETIEMVKKELTEILNLLR